MKEFFIVGNWKLNKTISESTQFVKNLMPLLTQGTSRCGIAAPFTALESLVKESKGTDLLIGSQNVSDQKDGAYTGEISAEMIKDVGAGFALIGHSERRQFYHESDELLGKKIKRALMGGLIPILCIGESLEQKQANEVISVLENQLDKALGALNQDEMSSICIAYEPVWAIGTGHAATPADVQKTHKIIRDFLARKWGEKVCYHLKILYGGSVKPDNIRELLSQPDIDGALIGGASLEVESFAKMVNIAREI